MPQTGTLPQLSILSPAKINLFLHINSKRADGYHNLQTVFRLLDWGDTIHFAVSQKLFNIHQSFENSNLPISLDSDVAVTTDIMDNLITKAAVALIKYVKKECHRLGIELTNTLPIINIKLDKVLPTGSGLGGGSSNAATTLLALNKLWGFNLDQQTLIDIGSCVGADVPIFIFGRDAVAEGIGEKLTAINLPHQHYLLLNPKVHASTKSLFAHPQLRRDVPVIGVSDIQQNNEGYLDRLYKPYSNVFQPVVVETVPKVRQALHYLQQLESITHSTARMTGTGSSVFLPIPQALIPKIQTYIKNNRPPCPTLITQSLLLKNSD